MRIQQMVNTFKQQSENVITSSSEFFCLIALHIDNEMGSKDIYIHPVWKT